MTRPTTVLDTCCLINLCAISRPLEQLLREISFQLYVSRAVEREEISIRPRIDAQRHERCRIDLGPYFGSGILRRCDVETASERELYIQLATQLDDGEAMSLAVAASRNWIVSSDDKPARRIAAELGVTVMGTPEILKMWAEHNAVPVDQIADAIDCIESLARFVPTMDLPEFQWWTTVRQR